MIDRAKTKSTVPLVNRKVTDLLKTSENRNRQRPLKVKMTLSIEALVLVARIQFETSSPAKPKNTVTNFTSIIPVP